ncbi:MAG: ABC transporter ATP-binding protein [Chitinophagaceae bacterium]
MPPDDILTALAHIKNLAFSNPAKASDLLVGFACKYAIDSKLITESVLIQNDINASLQENLPEYSNTSNLSEDIVSLSIRIGEDYIQNPDKEKIAASNNILLEKFNELRPAITSVAKVENLSFYYSRKSKSSFELSNIDLDLKYGQITGVVGENGNGKTTLLKIIAGLLNQKSGKLIYPALFDKTSFNYEKLKQQLAYIPQRLPQWNGKVKDNLHFMASIKGIRGKENIREVGYIISRLGLEEYENCRWDELSGGYQMRFELANMLVWKPKLLVLDEPLANLDIKSQIDFLRTLREITSNIRNPLSVIISSQHLLMIENIADNIIFLKNGTADFNGPMKCVGENRKENVYEVECSLSIHELRNVLQGLPVSRIRSNGFSYIVYTDLNITSTDITHKFKIAGIQIKLFRDISTSTKSLFEIGQD